MTSLKTRLEILEKKMLSDNEMMPSSIIISAESGRLDATPDESDIVRYTSDNEIYDREPGESEEDFTARATKAARLRLPSPRAVPTLFAVTKNMLDILP